MYCYFDLSSRGCPSPDSSSPGCTVRCRRMHCPCLRDVVSRGMMKSVKQRCVKPMTKSVTFRVDDDKLDFLDELARSMDRDRSYLINQAIDDFLEVRRWQIEQIRKAVADADAGDFASEEEVEAAFAAFRTTP